MYWTLKLGLLSTIIFRSHIFSGRIPTLEDMKKIFVPTLAVYTAARFVPRPYHKFLLASLQFFVTPIPAWLFWYDLVDSFTKSAWGRKLRRPIWFISPLHLVSIGILMQLFHEAPQFIDASYRSLVHSMLGVGYHYPLRKPYRLACRQCPPSARTLQTLGEEQRENRERAVAVGKARVDVTRRVYGERPRGVTQNADVREALGRLRRRLESPLLTTGKFYGLLFLGFRPLASRRLPRRDDARTAAMASLGAVGASLTCDLGGLLPRDDAPLPVNLFLRLAATLPGHIIVLICPLQFRIELLNVMTSQGISGLSAFLFSRLVGWTGYDAEFPESAGERHVAGNDNLGPPPVATVITSTSLLRRIVTCLHPVLLPDGKCSSKILSLLA